MTYWQTGFIIFCWWAMFGAILDSIVSDIPDRKILLVFNCEVEQIPELRKTLTISMYLFSPFWICVWIYAQIEHHFRERKLRAKARSVKSK